MKRNEILSQNNSSGKALRIFKRQRDRKSKWKKKLERQRGTAKVFIIKCIHSNAQSKLKKIHINIVYKYVLIK